MMIIDDVMIVERSRIEYDWLTIAIATSTY